MKIIHLNSYDGSGGAARAAERLNIALNSISANSSSLYVNYKKGNNPDIHTFNNNKLSRFWAWSLSVLDQLFARSITKKLRIPFSTPIFGTSLKYNKAVLSADIIHLHWINQGFLNLKNLKEILELGKIVVWTFHDCWAFTGGCHVRYDCKNYKDKCGNCYILKKSSSNDYSHWEWLQKKKVFDNDKAFSIISPSNWLRNGVKESSLLSSFNSVVIPNGIDTDVFINTDKIKARELLGLPSNVFLMLTGFMPSKVDKHKGVDFLKQALELFSKKVDNSTIAMMSFGSNNANCIVNDIEFYNQGLISDDSKLALIYAAADVFLTTTLDDNLPNTVMESLSCGTAVISFKTGGIPDMVDHKCNGYLAEYKDINDFCDGLLWAYTHNDKLEISKNARTKIETNFSMEVVAKKHVEFYNQLLNEKANT